MRRALIGLMVAGLALVAGCGDDEPSTGGGGGGDGEAALVVTAESGLKFDKETYSTAAGSITVELTNDDSLVHTLLVDGVDRFKLRVASRGDEDTGGVDLEAGTYTLYCDVPGHREGGMEAELEVS